jgi:hypothetical protein
MHDHLKLISQRQGDNLLYEFSLFKSKIVLIYFPNYFIFYGIQLCLITQISLIKLYVDLDNDCLRTFLNFQNHKFLRFLSFMEKVLLIKFLPKKSSVGNKYQKNLIQMKYSQEFAIFRLMPNSLM